MATTDLPDLATAAGTKFILALFVDLRGKPCAKLGPVEAVELLATEGVGFAGYAVGAIGQEPKDPDLMAIPDPASFTPIPFIKDGLAIVHCDPHVNGEPWPYAPRVILRALIAQCADAGFEPWVGAEVEYFLLTRNDDGSVAIADSADTAAQPCYDARGVTRMYDHLTAMSTAMNHAGLVQLRQRSRGRQRPVRAELPVRRRTDDCRPGHHAALSAVDDRRRTRHGRHLHAEAVRRPDRKRAASAPVADQRRRTGLSPPKTTTEASACPRRRTHSSAASSTTPAPCRRWSPNGQLLQANRRDHDRFGRILGSADCRRTAATTAPTTSGCPTPARRAARR